MSTSEEELRAALGLPPVRPPAPAAPQGLPQLAPPRDMRALLGLVDPEEEEEDRNLLQSLHTGFLGLQAGAVSGLLEPLTAVPWVRERMEMFDARRGDGWHDKVAYGFGWMGGSFIPGGLLFKVGGMGSRALRLAKVGEKAAEGVVELTRAGKLVRGGIAGSLWTIGQEAEDMEDRLKNVAVNAALFGVGDLVIDSAVRGVARWYRGKKGVPQELETAVQAARTSPGMDGGQSVVMARALSVIDDVIEREAGSALNMESLGSKRLGMQLGIQQLGLEEVRGGVMKIIPSIGGDVTDIQSILKNLDFDSIVLNRSVPILQEGGTVRWKKVQDIMVAKKGELDPRFARDFERQGWIPGMDALYRGRKVMIVTDTKDPNKLMAVNVDGARGAYPVNREDLHILPLIQAPTRALPDPANWWSKFVQEHGEWPFSVPETGDPSAFRGFASAFKDFTDKHAIGGIARERLKLYFLQRQRQALKAIDPELDHVLSTVGKTVAGSAGKGHPEGPLLEMASMKGFLQEWAPREQGFGFDIVLRNQKTGGSLRFKDQNAAREFLKNYGIDPGDMVQGLDSPVGVGAVAVGEGVGVMPAHSALEKSGGTTFSSSLFWSATSRVLPREAFIRRGEDLMRQQGFRDIPYMTEGGTEKLVPLNFWSGNDGVGGFMHIREGLIRVRNELFGKYAPEGRAIRNWMGELTQMRGGRRDLKTIRREKIDDWWQTWELPVAEQAAAAQKAGLTASETKLLQQANKYLDDLFERVMPHIDAENLVTGAEFRTQYLPYFRRMSSARWGPALDDTFRKQGSEINNALQNLMDDAYNQGMVGKHDRDPFTVLGRITDFAFKKVHVERHYKATQNNLNQVLRAMKNIEDPTTHRNLEMVHNSMREYMHLVRGGAPETYAALNTTVKNLFDSLDIKVSDVAFDRMINTMVSLNYGAFMGFRLGQPLRNLTQQIFGTLTRVGSTNYARGIESVFRNPAAARREAFDVGVLTERGMAIAMDDVVMTRHIQQLAQGSHTRAGRLTEKALAAGARLEDLSNYSLGGKLRVGNTEVPIGLFNASDEVNRLVSYFSQKHKTIKAINNWRTRGWSVEKFNDQAGLNQFGETVTAEFHRRFSANQDDAIRFVSRLMSDDTQFMYQLGAGPAWMAHGIGRLIGQYGTWPAWYAEHLRKGMMQGSTADKVRFMGWTAAAHAALIGVAYETGLNLSRWTGLTSLGWAGGPFFDWAKDMTSIWGGLQQDGRPTAARQMALGKMGLQDIGPGEGLAGHARSYVPGGPTQIRVKDPYKLFENTVGMFTPGMFAIRDAMRTAEAAGDGEPGEALIAAFGLRRSTTIGNTWPEMNFTR